MHKGENRTVTITAREAKVSKDENYFELTGPVRLEDSDGFWLETDTATVNQCRIRSPTCLAPPRSARAA